MIKIDKFAEIKEDVKIWITTNAVVCGIIALVKQLSYNDMIQQSPELFSDFYFAFGFEFNRFVFFIAAFIAEFLVINITLLFFVMIYHIIRLMVLGIKWSYKKVIA